MSARRVAGEGVEFADLEPSGVRRALGLVGVDDGEVEVVAVVSAKMLMLPSVLRLRFFVAVADFLKTGIGKTRLRGFEEDGGAVVEGPVVEGATVGVATA